MFIYNVTAHVEPSVEKEWLEWMEQEHIPEMHKRKFGDQILFFTTGLELIKSCP
ncbi:MAG: DUF4286 family protein [Flavobacteriia bacterium]|nr:DUF4286 family protein [Flavobacteriia bacterium]